MPKIRTTPFHVVCAVLGTFLFVFTFVSYLLKERLYISEAFISLLAGVVVSPHTTDIVNPLTWVEGSNGLETATLDFTRLVLSVQVCLAGIQLPGRYARREWRALAAVLGPGLLGMWLISSLFIWAIIAFPNEDGEVVRMPFMHAMAIGACIAPTDPVLSNTIIKGRWADKHVPVRMAQLISAESGANDGLGYPFLFFALYLMKYLGTAGSDGADGHGWAAGGWGGAASAMGMWFGETWLYVIILSVVWGAVVGWLARRCLQITNRLGYVDQESFFSFSVVMAVFLIGTSGMVGSDDILACFVAETPFLGSDDWFRQETKDDSFEPTIDTLLNVFIFIWFGAVCPWPLFALSVVSLWRLVVLSIVVLLLRRPPVLLVLQPLLSQVNGVRQALFVGFFGPIGVSAIFYQHLAMEFLRKDVLQAGNEEREDARILIEVVRIVVWFLVICSIIVHGLAIPAYQFGLYILHHTRPGRFEEEERLHIRRMLRREKENIAERPRMRRLEDGAEEAVERIRKRRSRPFRRVRVDNGS